MKKAHDTHIAIEKRILQDPNLSLEAKGFWLENLISSTEYEMTDEKKKIIDELISYGLMCNDGENDHYIFFSVEDCQEYLSSKE